MTVSDAKPLCRHCERRPAESDLGLCPACHDSKGVRELYRPRRAGRGPQWERHLQALARRARRGLPVGGIGLAETL
jgi:hypothetical protein